MHRLIQDHLEQVLSAKGSASGLSAGHPAMQHLEQCEDCRVLVDMMRQQSTVIQDGFGRVQNRSVELEPAPGFYARVMERIEAQRPVSVWNLFFDSLWGRRLATASLAVALLLTGYVVSSEALSNESNRSHAVAEAYPSLPTSDFEGEVFTTASNSANVGNVPTGNAVFASLVSYRER